MNWFVAVLYKRKKKRVLPFCKSLLHEQAERAEQQKGN